MRFSVSFTAFSSMAESSKRTECVKVCMSEEMFLDLNHDAIHADRTLAEFIYLLLRDWKYGHGTRRHPGREGTERDRDAP